MSLPEPFVYPAQAHIRKHAPAGYSEYERYKIWLRDDFSFRCVYCLHRETWYPDGAASFSAEHVLPQSHDPGGESVRDYSNLIYACLACNSVRQNHMVPDPTREGLGLHLRVQPDGVVTALTYDGLELVRILRLNRHAAIKDRRRILRLLARRAAYPHDPGVRQDFDEAFGHPDDQGQRISNC